MVMCCVCSWVWEHSGSSHQEQTQHTTISQHVLIIPFSTHRHRCPTLALPTQPQFPEVWQLSLLSSCTASCTSRAPKHQPIYPAGQVTPLSHDRHLRATSDIRYNLHKPPSRTNPSTRTLLKTQTHLPTECEPRQHTPRSRQLHPVSHPVVCQVELGVGQPARVRVGAGAPREVGLRGGEGVMVGM